METLKLFSFNVSRTGYGIYLIVCEFINELGEIEEYSMRTTDSFLVGMIEDADIHESDTSKNTRRSLAEQCLEYNSVYCHITM